MYNNNQGQYYYYSPPPSKPRQGFGTVSLVLGLIVSCVVLITFIFAVLMLIYFSSIESSGDLSGLALAFFILLPLLFLILFVLFISFILSIMGFIFGLAQCSIEKSNRAVVGMILSSINFLISISPLILMVLNAVFGNTY